MENVKNKEIQFISKFLTWIFGQGPEGLGTLLLGIAGLVALYQTNGILDKIMEIQKQAGVINRGVMDIDQGVKDIKQAVDLLRKQLIENHAIQTVQNSPLKNADVTKEQIQKVIDSIPSAASNGITIYLPQEDRSQVVEKLQQAQTPEERQSILQNALQYKVTSENFSAH